MSETTASEAYVKDSLGEFKGHVTALLGQTAEFRGNASTGCNVTTRNLGCTAIQFNGAHGSVDSLQIDIIDHKCNRPSRAVVRQITQLPLDRDGERGTEKHDNVHTVTADETNAGTHGPYFNNTYRSVFTTTGSGTNEHNWTEHKGNRQTSEQNNLTTQQAVDLAIGGLREVVESWLQAHQLPPGPQIAPANA